MTIHDGESRPSSERITYWLSFIAGIAALISGIIAFGLQNYEHGRPTSPPTTNEIVELKKSLEDTNYRIIDLLAKIKSIESTLSSLSSIPKEDAVYIQVQQVISNVTDLKAREDKLEAIILNNPAKALEMPLIERDVENIKSTQQANFNSMKDSVDRIYDLNKWLLGAMAVGILSLAVSNFLKTAEKK